MQFVTISGRNSRPRRLWIGPGVIGAVREANEGSIITLSSGEEFSVQEDYDEVVAELEPADPLEEASERVYARLDSMLPSIWRSPRVGRLTSDTPNLQEVDREELTGREETMTVIDELTPAEDHDEAPDEA